MMWSLGRFGYGAAHAVPWLGWVGPIVMIAFWALVVVAIVFFIRYIVRQSQSGRRESSALEILKERYAKGEISREEYTEKRKDLL
jgi:putative membrane protein